MRKCLLLILALSIAGCTPVLDRDIMNQGTRELPFRRLRESPDAYKGKLFILGGLIVETRFTEKGSQIEALALSVDFLGYPEEGSRAPGRFIAVYPREKGLLDPMIYKKGSEVTLAGEFVESRKGRIDEMEYVYPVFEVRQIYLWDERATYYGPAYTYPYYEPVYYYPQPFLYDPWGRHQPYPYRPHPPR